MIDAIDAIYQRFNSDAPLKALVGEDENGDIRAFPEWPDEETDWESEVSRIAITPIVPVQNRGTDETQIQVDFFYRKNVNGIEPIGAIDKQIMALLNEQWWNDTNSGKRIWCVQTGGSVRPSADEDPWHWMRQFALRAS
jgi:hypothetical protein